mgnify:CR=1 FL=1
MDFETMTEHICVVGAGYVGLPLAMALSEHCETTVYSHSPAHLAALNEGRDRTESFTVQELQEASLRFSDNLEEVAEANIYIVTVPTPVDKEHNPDLTPVRSATETVASVLKKGDLVIYESTVYVGCTEELCAPLLAKVSGLEYNRDFFCGFSPERINPADKERTIHDVMKIVAGSTPQITQKMKAVYSSIVDAGIHVAPSMKVAEASKLLENIQRDVNIALMNEVSALFNALDVDTHDVIEAASTKWNFHPYYPGLVGGHCISVDPYYLVYNGRQKGVATPLIEQSRAINNHMVKHIVDETLLLIKKRGIEPKRAAVLFLGVTFKEDCPDIRNSQSVKIINALEKELKEVDVYDPVVNREELLQLYALHSLEQLEHKKYDAFIISVGHSVCKRVAIKEYLHENGVLLDLKGILPKDQSDFRL